MMISELVREFLAWNARHRSPKTSEFYDSRLKAFVRMFGGREWGSLTPLQVDEYLHAAGQGNV